MEEQLMDTEYSGYMGIDPGKSGGLALISEEGELVQMWAMPMINKVYDIPEIIKIIEESRVNHLVLEDVNAIAKASSSSSFEFGRGKGILEGVIATLEVPHTLVQPKAWQKIAWEGVLKLYKYGKVNKKTGKRTKSTDTKATSEVAAKRLFPKADYRDPNRKTDRAKSMHDGIIDAALIAYYCKRQFKR